ncbi:segregation/condensation protein A [bacterium]|nr:segregation/condensation protein A [bacterium]
MKGNMEHTPENSTPAGQDAAAPDAGEVREAVAAEVAARAERHRADGPESWNLENLPPELDYFRNSEAYQVELTGFQGPMDLLLFLIDKEQVDIYDIPIALITEQFIRHIEVMHTISLDKAGEFIAMAATLMVIKMKMLMPSHLPEDEEEEEDPRAELVRKLLEYKRFKEAAEALQRKESERQQYHLRQTRFPFSGELDLEPRLRIEMFDLLSALAGIFDRVQAKTTHDVVREPYTVEEKMSLIEEKIGAGGTVRFEELFSDDTIKMEVIVTFIAVLEMVKRGRLQFMQTEPRGPIWIQHPGVDATDVADDEDEGGFDLGDEDHVDAAAGPAAGWDDDDDEDLEDDDFDADYDDDCDDDDDDDEDDADDDFGDEDDDVDFDDDDFDAEDDEDGFADDDFDDDTGDEPLAERETES